MRHDSAVCTTAAPFFFKAKDVDHLDTYQDGGLEHNNPAFIASWESAVIWPQSGRKSNIDHMISLGTGSTTSVKYKVGPHSPVRDRFLKRLFGNYMGHLDGEKQWKTFFHCVPREFRSRYHRLNISFPGPEPAIDDVSAIEQLKHQATEFMNTGSQAIVSKDAMIASMFYFELERYHNEDDNTYSCSGTIRCRLSMDYAARKKLYNYLAERSTMFLISGRPIASVQPIPKGLPAFRRHLNFVLQSLDDEVHITIRGATSTPTTISGLPCSLRHLATAQELTAPFGRRDHRLEDEALPELPRKRKHVDFCF